MVKIKPNEVRKTVLGTIMHYMYTTYSYVSVDFLQ